MLDRMITIGCSMLKSDKKVSERVVELGVACLTMNELFTEVTKGNETKLKEVAKKCAEISVLSDSIIHELYLTNQVSLEELNNIVDEKIKQL